MARRIVKCNVGDVFAAEIRGKDEVYIQYLGLIFNNTLPAVRVFSGTDMLKEQIIIPEVLVGISPPIRSGEWKLVKKNATISPPIGPLLKCTFKFSGTTAYPNIWTVFDGDIEIEVGHDPPERYLDCTTTLVSSWQLLKEDLESGENSNSVRSVIKWRDRFPRDFNSR